MFCKIVEYWKTVKNFCETDRRIVNAIAILEQKQKVKEQILETRQNLEELSKILDKMQELYPQRKHDFVNRKLEIFNIMCNFNCISNICETMIGE